MIGSHGICLLDGDGTGMVLHTVHDTLNTQDDCPNAHVPLSMYLLMLVDATYGICIEAPLLAFWR